jgi:hypothetical protein
VFFICVLFLLLITTSLPHPKCGYQSKTGRLTAPFLFKHL